MDVKTSTESRITAEHSNITLRCDSTSNPRPNLYLWLITNRQHSFQINSSTENISISDVHRDFSAACIAHNIIGAGRSAKADLHVACKNSNLIFSPVILNSGINTESLIPIHPTSPHPHSHPHQHVHLYLIRQMPNSAFVSSHSPPELNWDYSECNTTHL